MALIEKSAAPPPLGQCMVTARRLDPVVSQRMMHGNPSGGDAASKMAVDFTTNTPTRVQLMRVAKPLFDPVAYRGATNRRRYYEEVALPRNLVVLGDAVCTFNPAYGQGISTAALQAATLQTQLQVKPATQDFGNSLGSRLS